MQNIGILFLLTLCLATRSTHGVTRMISSDFVYFPDQADYIKHSMRCADNLILWPGTGKCYKEGEQGPCNIGRVLVFDDRLFKPFCRDL